MSIPTTRPSITVHVESCRDVVKEGLVFLFEQDPDCIVSTRVDDPQHRPDVIVLAVSRRLARYWLTKFLGGPPVIVLLEDLDGVEVHQLLVGGAKAVLCECQPAIVIKIVVMMVAMGLGQKSLAATRWVPDGIICDRNHKAGDFPKALTELDIKVWEQAANGLGDQDISLEIGISIRSVRRHIQRIYRVLGIHHRAEVVARWWHYQSLQSDNNRLPRVP